MNKIRLFLVVLILLTFSHAKAQQRVPDAPDADPRPGIGYVWGEYWGRLYASNDLGFPDFDAKVRVCVYRLYGDPECFILHPYYYDNQLGRTWFESDPITTCGPDWFIWWATWDNVRMDIHQPSDYYINCIYLPTLKKG